MPYFINIFFRQLHTGFSLSFYNNAQFLFIFAPSIAIQQGFQLALESFNIARSECAELINDVVGRNGDRFKTLQQILNSSCLLYTSFLHKMQLPHG